jgi:hypothetical protein
MPVQGSLPGRIAMLKEPVPGVTATHTMYWVRLVLGTVSTSLTAPPLTMTSSDVKLATADQHSNTQLLRSQLSSLHSRV